MSTLSESQRLAAVSALGDPVRRELYELVQASAEPLSRDACAIALNLPRSTALAQLDKLVGLGLLAADFRKLGARTGPGSGRPTKLYRAAVGEIAASVPERHYDLAAQLLAAAVEKSITTGTDVRQTLETEAYDAGTRLGADACNIELLLGTCGYAPAPDGAGGYLLHNCPFHQLARTHTRVVCGLNAALLRGALDGCRDAVRQVVPDPGGQFCCARITTVKPA